MSSSTVSTCAIVVPAGNAVAVAVEWRDMEDNPEAPVSVRYQVFDHVEEANVSPQVDVSPVGTEMEITVPGEHLPANAEKRRRLAIKIEATFGVGDKHTVTVEVYVAKEFTWV